MKKVLSTLLTLPSIFLLVGCSGSSISYEAGDKIFTEKIIFDTSVAEPENVHFKLGVKGSVTALKSGRTELEFGYNNEILTISGKSLKECGPGEKSIKVSYKDESGKEKNKTIYSFNATKFITTPQEFQNINNDLDGYYILMNDLDFANFGNFEPLGNYTYEEDPNKKFFHGILDGNGYSIKNLTASYSDGPESSTESHYPTNKDVYNGAPKFTTDGHKEGNNIGVFQFIGSSGVVKNLVFDGVKVHGHTIVGVIAGNVSGTVENCLVKSNCSVLGDSHFWDDDCNVGGAFGIVGGSGKVNHVVCLAKDVNIRPEYEDYNDDYVGEVSKSPDKYDHPNASDNFWRFWNANKVQGDPGVEYKDSNNSYTNGVYSVVGKCWGLVSNSVGAKFKVKPYEQEDRDCFFGQTHVGANKPASGPENLGELSECHVYDDAGLKASDAYSGFDNLIWKIAEGEYPTLNQDLVPFIVAE